MFSLKPISAITGMPISFTNNGTGGCPYTPNGAFELMSALKTTYSDDRDITQHTTATNGPKVPTSNEIFFSNPKLGTIDRARIMRDRMSWDHYDVKGPISLDLSLPFHSVRKIGQHILKIAAKYISDDPHFFEDEDYDLTPYLKDPETFLTQPELILRLATDPLFEADTMTYILYELGNIQSIEHNQNQPALFNLTHFINFKQQGANYVLTFGATAINNV